MKTSVFGNINKRKIIISVIVLLFVVCGLAWRFLPVHFLHGIEAEEVAAVKVFNGNNGDEFEITNPEDISNIVDAIKQISFQKEDLASEVPYWYHLTFVNENGEEITSLGVLNSWILRKDITQKWMCLYRCDGELSAVGDYLERLEAVQFPDYNKDPDFSH